MAGEKQWKEVLNADHIEGGPAKFDAPGCRPPVTTVS